MISRQSPSAFLFSTPTSEVGHVAYLFVHHGNHECFSELLPKAPTLTSRRLLIVECVRGLFF